MSSISFYDAYQMKYKYSVLYCLFFTQADVKITYLVKNYANKENFDIRLKKCETFSFLGDHCDPTFHFNGYTISERYVHRSCEKIFLVDSLPFLFTLK